MKILTLVPVYPIPTDNGAKRRILAFLDYFSANHDLTVAALVPGDPEEYPEENWQLELLSWNETTRISVVKSLFSIRSYREVKFWEPALQEKVEDLLAKEDYDLIWVNSLNMTRYLERWWLKAPNHPLMVLDQHNVDSCFWQSFLTNSPNLLVRIFASIEKWKAERLQASWYPRFNGIVSVSPLDHEASGVFFPGDKTHLWIAPNGVDLEYFAPDLTEDKIKDPAIIVFSGSMDAYMNQQAVIWFFENCWETIQGSIPGVEFHIVGRNPPTRIIDLQKDPRIRVSGTVPDIRQYIKRAGVFVIPIHLGGGTKLKAVEAMAMGLPVVSTSQGALGLEVDSGIHLLIADTPEDFSEQVIEVLQNPLLAKSLGKEARTLVEKVYNWEVIYQSIEEILLDLL